MLPDEERGEYGMFGATSGANGVRPRWARMLPAHLKQAGYRSYHSGKWHMDGDRLPAGFRPLVFAGGSQPLLLAGKPFRRRCETSAGESRTAVITPPPTSRTTRSSASRSTRRNMRTARSSNTSPSPRRISRCTPCREDIAIYRDRYLDGWEKIRNERFARMREDGHRQGRTSADGSRSSFPAGISRRRSRSRKSARTKWPAPWHGIRSLRSSAAFKPPKWRSMPR